MTNAGAPHLKGIAVSPSCGTRRKSSATLILGAMRIGTAFKKRVFMNEPFHYYRPYKDDSMTDRRPLNPSVTVPKPGGGVQPRSRNQDGQVRDKRDDAGKPRKK